MTWENDNSISRNEAIEAIKQKAKDDGIRGTYKVFYDGRIVAGPTDLPERVDMDKVRISAALDNA